MDLSALDFSLVAVAAVVMAADQALGQTSTLKNSIPQLVGVLRFVPAVLVAVAVFLYILNQWNPKLSTPPTVLPQSNAVPAPNSVVSASPPLSASPAVTSPKPPIAPAPPTKTGLEDLTNHALRVKVYSMDDQLQKFVRNWFRAEEAIKNKKLPDAEKASALADVDEQYSNTFRGEYARDMLAMDQELMKRTGQDAVLKISIRTGILVYADIDLYSIDLQRLANLLK